MVNNGRHSILAADFWRQHDIYMLHVAVCILNKQFTINQNPPCCVDISLHLHISLYYLLTLTYISYRYNFSRLPLIQRFLWYFDYIKEEIWQGCITLLLEHTYILHILTAFLLNNIQQSVQMSIDPWENVSIFPSMDPMSTVCTLFNPPIV